MNNSAPQNQSEDGDWLPWVNGIIIILVVVGVIIFITKSHSNNSNQTSATRINEDNTNADLIQSKNIREPTLLPSTTQKECLHTNMVQFSTTEESRMKEIMVSVMQGSADMPTLAIYNEFWSIMNQHGKLCDEDIALTKNSVAAAAECNKLFYQDALLSLRTGQTYKSPQRLDCENKTISAVLPADKANARIKANENLMLKIVSGQPIATATGNIVFTEVIIQLTLDDINAKLTRINKLFATTPPLSLNNTPTQPSEEPSLHITRNPALDKQCEEEHGPSVYKSVPKSLGGGAYCDCKPGYILKPMVLPDGTPSSWCTKE